MHSTRTDATVLVIDDEPEIRHVVRSALRSTVARVLDAADGRSGLEAVRGQTPDLIVLDLGLPDQSGLDLCRAIRAYSLAPIVVLTARHIESDKVALLNAGADDYVTKPFSTSEFAARVAAQIRRARTARPGTSGVVEADGVSIDFTSRHATRDDNPIRLTPIEWAILRALTADPGRVYTHQQLFDAVWAREFGDARQYLRVHITNLRRKVERDPTHPHVIITEPGVGYRFGTPMAQESA
ncbi:MAG: response regulator transcription factor [Gemmatimonadaceae bacterium]